MAYPTLIKCNRCGLLAPIVRNEGVEVSVKKLGQLEEVTQTELYSTYLYDCPFCGYSAIAQPENAPPSKKER